MCLYYKLDVCCITGVIICRLLLCSPTRLLLIHIYAVLNLAFDVSGYVDLELFYLFVSSYVVTTTQIILYSYYGCN